MSLTLNEVEHIALLARLELTDDEKQRYRQQLSHILAHVAQLQQLDTSGIDPSSPVQPDMARLRADEPGAGLGADGALANAPDSADGQFRVPPVLD